MRLQVKPLARGSRQSQLPRGPGGPSSRIVPYRGVGERRKLGRIRGMCRHELSLQMRRQLADREAGVLEATSDFVAIRLTFRRERQIKEPPIPRRNLHARIA